MTDPISTSLSVTALLISSITAWYTLLRRGNVRMTNPTFISFSYDNVPNRVPQAKIFIRTLLYSTGKRGHLVENMYVKVHRVWEKQSFNIWGHGNERLSRGSGIFVGETGICENHHFTSITALPENFFIPGPYTLEIFLSLSGRKKALHASTINVTVPENARQDMLKPNAAIWFDWEPETQSYHAHIEER